MTQDIATTPKPKGDANLERVDDQEKANHTHDIVYVPAREEPRSISPEIGNNVI